MSAPQLDFSKDYVLENSRARLSALGIEHISALSTISGAAEIWTYFLEKGEAEEELNDYIQAAIQKRVAAEEYPFVVFDKRTSRYAGITRLYAYDKKLGNIKMGHTWYGKEFWGTGLNKACKLLLFQFCFEQLRVERIGFGVHGENKRSVRALQKVGCLEEGRLRNFLDGVQEPGRTDLLLFSILREEWFKKVKAVSPT